MVQRIRRVVTGHDRNGKSVFIADGKAPNILEMKSMPGVALTDLWRTTTSPASNGGNRDAATGKIRLEPPENGTILRIVEIPPDTAWRKTANAKAAFASIGAGAVVIAGSDVGRFATVGAGAIVTRSVPDHALVVGNPARQIGWVCPCGRRKDTLEAAQNCGNCGKQRS